MQTRLVKYFTDRIEQATGVKIQIGGVDFRPIKSLVLNDVLLRDYRNDTLLYCHNFKVEVDSFRFSARSFKVKNVELDRAYVNLWIERGETESIMNIDVFMNSLQKGSKASSGKSSGGGSWLVGLDKIGIRDSRVVYREADYDSIEYGINWTDVECSSVNMDISELDFSGGRTGLRISGLSLKEKSGFIIERLDAKVSACDSNLLITESRIITERSMMNLDKLEYNWTPDRHDWRYFTTRMQQYYKLSPSRISFIDLAYFNEVLRGIDNTVVCSGVVSNTVNKIEGHNLKIEIGKSTLVHGRFKSDGLPDVKNTVFEIDFHNTRLNPADLETIYLPWFKCYISLPAPLHRWKSLDVDGTFRGTLSDFVLAGRSNSSGLKGEASFAYTPCHTRPRECSEISGHFNFPAVDVGRMVGSSILGYGNVLGDYKGHLDDKDSDLNMTGKVNTLNIHKGKVKDIDVYLTLENEKLNVISSLNNDSVRAGVVMTYEQDNGTSFFSSKGHLVVNDLKKFGVSLAGENESLKTSFEAVYAGDEKKNSFGNFAISGLDYSNTNGNFQISRISLENRVNDGYYITSLLSDVVDMQIEGHYTSVRPLDFTGKLLKKYLPAYAARKKKDKKKTKLDDVDFRYNINIKDANRILRVVYPDLSISPGTKIYSDFGQNNGQIHLAVQSDSIRYKDFRFTRSRLDLKGDLDKLRMIYAAEEVEYSNMCRFYNVRNELDLTDNRVDNKLQWCNWGRHTYSGEISANVKFVPVGKDGYKTEIQVNPGVIVVSDSVWKVEKSTIVAEGKDISINDFAIRSGRQYLSVEGKVSAAPEEQLAFRVNEFNMSELNRVIFDNRLKLFGVANGEIVLKDYYKDHLLYSDITLRQWGLNKDTLGTLKLNSFWDADSSRVVILAENRVKNEVPLNVSGYYSPSANSMDVDIILSKVGLERLGVYAADYFTESKGGMSGRVNISGPISRPEFMGKLYFDSVALKMRDLNTTFYIDDSVQLNKSSLILKDLTVRDELGNKSTCSGYYRFWENKYDLGINSRRFLILNTSMDHNDSFYGKVYISGYTNINNKSGLTEIITNLRTENNSKLYLPLTSVASQEDGNFLHFINPNQPLRRRNQVQSDKKGMVVNANLEINDNLEVQIVFDPTIGDILKTSGNGDIKISLDQDGMVNMFGEYKIAKGDYLFTLSNLLNKKFILMPGGSIVWNGSPYKATIGINAVYNLKTSLYELLSSTNSTIDRSTKVPVECVLNLSDNFMNPLVKFDINFPTLDSQTKGFVQSLFSSQDELNKQMFSLLILNKFYTPDYMNRDNMEERNAGYQAGVTTATELVSNQLSRWLSQISNNFDIGLSYRPGDNITTNEIEVALSTQLLNDRVTLSANGNVDVGGTKSVTSAPTNSNNIAGDFDLDVKLNKQGTLKLKAYSHTDEKVIYNTTEMIQGVGVSYQEVFDTFHELFYKYLGFFKRKKTDKLE